MKKILLLGLMLLATNCSYKPVIDTTGRSGTYNEDRAREITNDLQHCKTLAKENTNSFVETGKYVWNYYFRASTLYLSPKVDYSYPKIYKKCLEGRGHSVVN